MNLSDIEKRFQGLQRQVAELEADAKRYRWLRGTRSVAVDTMLHGNGCRTHTAQELDAAIDAALNTETTG